MVDTALEVVIWQPAGLTLAANTQSAGRVANTTLRLNKKNNLNSLPLRFKAGIGNLFQMEEEHHRL